MNFIGRKLSDFHYVGTRRSALKASKAIVEVLIASDKWHGFFFVQSVFCKGKIIMSPFRFRSSFDFEGREISTSFSKGKLICKINVESRKFIYCRVSLGIATLVAYHEGCERENYSLKFMLIYVFLLEIILQWCSLDISYRYYLSSHVKKLWNWILLEIKNKYCKFYVTMPTNTVFYFS